MSLPKLLSIVGPTAVGKTALALSVAEKIPNCDVIVADSRQVYRGLEIVSGADIPENFQSRIAENWSELNTYFEHDSTRLFGVSLIQPTEEWSVSNFQKYALRVCDLSWQQGRLPVIVGGTGLYQTQLLNQDQRLHIPPDLVLRAQADGMAVLELQELLKIKNPAALVAMNDSDRQNPRRLIRAIEKTGQPEIPEIKKIPVDELIIGLNDTIEVIELRIKQRVQSRLEAGALAEVGKILATVEDRTLPIWSATGVRALIALSQGQIDYNQCIELWTRQERQYAKRQLTWWKKRSNITWYQIEQPNWQLAAQSQIDAWYEA